LRVIPALSLIALIFFLLRGPYLSNSIKRVLIPVLENATGERIITDHAVINLFPFYLQVKSIRIFDKDGNRLLWVTKTRAYIDLLALLHGEIRVRRLTLKEPNLTATKRDLERVIKNIKNYLSGGKGKRFAFTLKSIKIIDGEFTLKDTGKFRRLSGRGLAANAIVKNNLMVDWSLDKGKIHFQGLSELAYGMTGRIRLNRNGEMEVLNIEIDSFDSKLDAKGRLLFTSDGNLQGGRLTGEARVFIETINRLFGIKDKVEKGKDGVLTFSGSVDLTSLKVSGWPDLLFDLKTKGFFYLEDLMRLLKVKDTIKGRLSLDGRLSGRYPDILGKGKARLEEALFVTLPLSDIVGEVEYRNKRFTLNNFIAHTYGGELRGDAYLLIPHGDYFVKASVSEVVSTGFFRFIKWDAPFPEGIINGVFRLNKLRGKDFEIESYVNYINTSVSEGGPLNRLINITGEVNLKNRIVGIKNARLSTLASELFMNGRVNLKRKGFDLDLRLNSRDVSELVSPTLTGLRGDLKFTGKAEGSYNNPEISGSLQIGSGGIKDFTFSSLAADLTYTIGSLKLKSLNLKHDKSSYDISGFVSFKKAKRLFSFDEPFFDVKVSMRDGDARALIKTFYKDVPISGTVDGTVSFKGTQDKYRGKSNLLIKKAKIYGQDFDRITLEASFYDRGIDFHSLLFSRGTSELRGDGSLYPDERFKLSLTSNELRIKDITPLQAYQTDAIMSNLKINASGTFDNPNLDFSTNILDGNFWGIQVKEGSVRGTLKNRTILFSASLLEDMISANGKVLVKKTPLWSVDIDFKKGDYGLLIKGLLKDVPEDFSMSVEGNVKLSGRGKRVSSMLSRFGSVNLSLYGYSFGNKGDVFLRLDKERMEIKSLSLIGDDADISIVGVLDIGEGYDVKMRGDLDMAPLRLLTDKISSLKGQGDFVINISGRWEKPDITGNISIRNVTTSIADFPYRIGPLNGRIFLKRDRLTFESLRGVIAGGTAVISGVGYFERLSLKRLFISSTLNGIRLSHIEGMSAVFDGELFYETSPKGSVLTGNINIRRARYERRVEWNRWLLGLRRVENKIIKQPTFLEGISLNIHVVGAENIIVDNNILRAPVKADLTIVGTLDRYGLIGSIETEEGSIYFRDNEFEIISGRVDFIETEEVKPLFNIKAETFTSGYKIRLNLEGLIDKLTLSLYSDPPLSESDILTLLTAGQINKEERGFESGIAASEATAILTGGIQDVFEEKVKGITGIERFEINPQTTSTGAVSPRITIGKRILNERLSVSYTTSIGTTEESIVRLKYGLGKNISIIGTRDEMGSVGVDLNYRFEFK